MTDFRRDRFLIGVTSACAIALVAPMAWPLLTGRVFWFDDLATFHLPLRHLYQQALHAGDSLLWTPSLLSGFYLHGEGQVGMYHPLHQIIYRLFSLTVAFDVELLLNYVAAFWGMYCLAQRLRFHAAPSLVAAMLFAFSSFLVLHHHHLNLVATGAHLPWLLAAADVLLKEEKRMTRAAGYAGAALVLASEILIGFPQGVWFSVLALAAFVLFRVAQGVRLSRVAVLSAALGTGALLGAVQLLPTMDVTAGSIRPLLPRAFALTYSLHPANLVQLWSPYVFAGRVYTVSDYAFVHEFGLYSGALLVLGPFWVWIRRREIGSRRPLAIAAGASAALALVLALGRYGGLYQLLLSLPGFSWGRAPTRYMFLFEVALVVIAAIVVEDLQQIVHRGEGVPMRPLWFLCVPALLSVLTTILVSSRLLHVLPTSLLSPLSVAAVGTLFVVGTTILMLLAAQGRRGALPALVLLAAVDLGWGGIRQMYVVVPRSVASLMAGMPRPSDTPGVDRLFISGPGTPGNLLLLNGFRLSSGYVALEPARYLDPASTRALQLSGSNWIWLTNTGLQRIAGAVDRARLIPEGHADDTPGFVSSSGAARLIVDRPGDIVVETTAPESQVLALAERFHAGWQATADGDTLTIVRVHEDFLGCVVPAGSHRVAFRFRPRSFVYGVALSGVGVLLLGIGLAVIMRSAGAEEQV
jgi:hypothetical protein